MDPPPPLTTTTTKATVGTSGIERLYPEGSDGELILVVLHCISPWDCSPYHLRRVCRSFRGFYAERGAWIRLLRDHLSGTVVPKMTMKQARGRCNLALRGGWVKLIKGKTLSEFRDSGWTALDLSRKNIVAGKPMRALPKGR